MKCNDCGNETNFTLVTKREYSLECIQGKPVQGILDNEDLMEDEALCGKCQSKNVNFPEDDRDDVWHVL